MLLADVLSSLKSTALGPSSSRLTGANGGPGFEPEQEVQQLQGLLLLGRRGVGKTTLLRDIARVMSLPEEQGGMGLAVLVVDTYCDIAGDADLPHTALGAAWVWWCRSCSSRARPCCRLRATTAWTS
jgi:hypothetical protein